MSLAGSSLSPQDIQRKLAMHTAAKPKVVLGQASGTESDSDSVLSPEVTTSAMGHSMFHTGNPGQPPLSSIAESRSVDNDESDDDDAVEGGWRTPDLRQPRNSADETVIKSGYLTKKGQRRKTWKKRWFVLRPARLAYYKSNAEYQTLKLLDLSEIHSCTPVHLKRHDNTFSLISPNRTFYFQANSPEEVKSWVAAIEGARQALLATSTQTSETLPIAIPRRPDQTARRTSTLAISSSPGQLHITSSDSEDGGAASYRGGFGDYGSAPSPTAVSFATPSKPSTSAQTNPATKVIVSGYLMKCDHKRRNWRKRWFTLTSERLVYSGSHMDTKPHQTFMFNEILDALEYDLPASRHTAHSAVASSPPKAPALPETGESANTFKIVTTKRTLLLCAPTEEDEIRWLGAIRALIARRSDSGVVPGVKSKLFITVPTGQGAEAGSAATPATARSPIKPKTRRRSIGGGGGASARPPAEQEMRP